MQICDETEAVAYIKKRIASREWWIILAASDMGREMARCIEDRFYRGDKNAMFEMILLSHPAKGIPFAAIFTAKKSVMTKKRLEKLVKRKVGDRDVILTPDIPGVFLEWFWDTFNYKTPSQN